jgi:hypothetical protein
VDVLLAPIAWQKVVPLDSRPGNYPAEISGHGQDPNKKACISQTVRRVNPAPSIRQQHHLEIRHTLKLTNAKRSKIKVDHGSFLFLFLFLHYSLP